MSTRRVLLSPSRVAISRPGYDVLNPPAFTSDFMALDSNFPPPERPILAGTLFNVALTSKLRVNYGATFATPPAVQIFPYDTYGTIFSRDLIFSSGIFASVILLICGPSFFILSNTAGGTDSFASTPHNWIYMVWKTSP